MNSRAKGRRIQTEGLSLLHHHGWQIIETSAGQDVEDACCMDPQGDWWAVEVKGDQTASVRSLWAQARRQADDRGDRFTPLLLWRIDRGGWWCIVSLDTIGEQWADRFGLFSHPPAPHLAPPASMALPTVARWLDRTNADPTPAVLLAGGELVAMPAGDALEVLR
ncbi:MAG TPA: hypothetical protein VFK52_00125 [Nocardioidaceae bacterium]|nr:hypothetical protein [Nocardioidaceae bacterium]